MSCEKHSCYPWLWDRAEGLYYQECSIYGCSYVVAFRSLIPIGNTLITEGGASNHDHDWKHWVCMHDQHGIRDSNEWLYKRTCASCNTEQMVEDLVGVDQVV